MSWSVGSLKCWGDNTFGQVDAPGGEFVAVSAGGSHSCGVLVEGSLKCWGDNTFGQADAPGGEFTSVAAGLVVNCAHRIDLVILCWPGEDPQGQPVLEYTGLLDISFGHQYRCAVDGDSTVGCSGGMQYDGGDVILESVPDIEFASVSTGISHMCGLRIDGAIECWGSNSRGQLDMP